MSKEIAKGNIILQKEEELKQLQVEYKKVSRNLKSNKTRLRNDREKLATVQREMAAALQDQQEKIMALQEELIKAAKKAKKSKKIRKEEKKEIGDFLDDIQSQIPSEEELKRMAEEFAEQRAKEDYERRLFERFHKQPPPEEQKSIRKVYIELSKRFHPDLAKNERELAYFNRIMVRVVRAYESADIAELLAIQKELATNTEEFSEAIAEQGTAVSLIQQKINKQANELKLLKGQLERTREELAELRNSEEGQLLADYKRFKKEGLDLIESMKVEMEAQVDNLEMVIDSLNEYATTGELPLSFLDMMMLETMPSFFGDDDDDMEFWDFDFDFDDWTV